MKGKAALLARFVPTPLQEVPLDLTPTAGTPSSTIGTFTPILTPNTWASIEQVFKDLTSTPPVETPGRDDIVSPLRPMTSSFVPTIVEALHHETQLAQNLSLKKAPPVFNVFHSVPQSNVVPSQVKTEKPAIVAATTTTTDAALGSNSQTQRRKLAGENGKEANKVVQRRERNRMAAARCRQRRVDLTQSLFQECRELKAEKAVLEEQLQQVQQQKEHLEFILQAHESLCKVKLMASNVAAVSQPVAVAASSVVVRGDATDSQEQQAAGTVMAAKRPSSLLLTPQANCSLPPKKKRL